ncbi:domain of unknown function DUF1731 [Desulforamulus reducens MI-1]|uniref:DUF1731 domain-containing protein n=1 Tax=Desulforamulus reducens (strain ATCC BAA-1160 / DSM 100696 / MI-1) TaxID=349161 RepID=A4J2H3_DESRM|nr:DUF1731 domain-containing protein [Desulforamulus reducens]ABO49276.1 domain of unknown function DUF1731 [Desulforamulus reducens MI-1]
MAKLLLGEMAEELLINGQRVLPGKLLSMNYPFKYPEIDSAIKDALAGLLKGENNKKRQWPLFSISESIKLSDMHKGKLRLRRRLKTWRSQVFLIILQPTP